jgi:excisionase family DNA binding protein
MQEVICKSFQAEAVPGGFRIRYDTAERSPLLSMKEVSVLLGVPSRSVYTWCSRLRNPIPHMRAGNRYRFNRDQVLDWMKRSAVEVPGVA